MLKKITCIECPLGCPLSVEMEDCRVIRVSGNKCPKGIIYASSEAENPARFLTSVISSRGLSLKMIPVRTDKPIPKSSLAEAMKEIKRLTINRPVKTGDIIVNDFMREGINLIATRDCV
ncbi:MAG: DUF1667 domain-containing protein [Candidatus Omnitrophica bacterium]|nr:DUF1667 domain-containing protein [Candidatus Omnitrophota bacterium]